MSTALEITEEQRQKWREERRKTREYWARMDAERKRIGATEVRQGHVPRWFRLRLLAAFREKRLARPVYYHSPWSMLQGDQLIDAAVRSLWGDSLSSWLDHWGSTMFNGQRIFVSEPYPGSWEDDTSLFDRLANACGCGWYLSDISWHYPGSTIRIGIYPR